MSVIGDRIRFKREQLGMSQEELAKQIGIKQPSLSDIESGRTKNPREATVRAIAIVFNDNLGDPKLDRYLNGSSMPNKREIIKGTTPEEYFSLRSDGETTERQIEEAKRILKLAQAKLKQMED